MSEPILRVPLSEAEAHRKRVAALEALVAKLEAENAELRAATPAPAKAKGKAKAKKNSSAPTTPLVPSPAWEPGARRTFLTKFVEAGTASPGETRELAEMRDGRRCGFCGHGAADTVAVGPDGAYVPVPFAHTPGCVGEVKP